MQYDDKIPNPDLGVFGNAIVDEALRRALVWLPAEVTAYFAPPLVHGANAIPAQVTLRVLIKKGRAIEHEDDLEQGETLELGKELDPVNGTTRADAFGGRLAISEYPPIPRAIVMRPGLGSTCRLRGPIPVGTKGVALISSRMIDRWQLRTGVVDPDFPATGAHLHNLASCVFLPTVTPGFDEVGDNPNLDAYLGNDAGTRAIEWYPNRLTVTATDLRLGLDGATLGVARATDPVGISAALATWMGNVQTALSGLGAPVAPLVGTQIGTITSGSPYVKSI